MIITVYTKALTAGDLLKKPFLKISQYLQENNLCWSHFLIKFLCLSEADQSLLKKEAAEFLQPEEISCELLYNLHYSIKFYLEAHRLFHCQISSQHTFQRTF